MEIVVQRSSPGIVSSHNWPSEPVTWSLLLSCAEPLRSVTGGIGTYSRLLLQRLASVYERILVCTANDFSAEGLPPNVTLLSITDRPVFEGRPVENLADNLLSYSFQLSQVLAALYEEGHRFQLSEFPDYGNDGYFSLALRKAGKLDLGRVLIRLHSPHLMLRDDNRWPRHLTPINIIEHGTAERFVLKEADGLLYGGDAMLERVLAYFDEQEQLALRSKAIRVPHPWPDARVDDHVNVVGQSGALSEQSASYFAEASVTHIGLIGRLEVRKGTLQMLDLFRKRQVFEPIPGHRVRFHFIGGSTSDWTGRSLADIVGEEISRHGLHSDVKLHGKIDQARLAAHVERLDAVMYPSLFENYPNALLEVMQQGKAVMVSKHGCMPELASGYPGAIVFDPLVMEDFWASYKAFVGQVVKTKKAEGEAAQARVAAYNARSVRENERLVQAYAQLRLDASKCGRAVQPSKHDILSVTFVVPHFNHAERFKETLQNLCEVAEPGDKIIVVDDCSLRDEVEKLKSLIERFAQEYPITLVAKDVNEGPGAARDDGLRMAATEAVQFIDADDQIDPKGMAVARDAMRLNPEIGLVFGYQQCTGEARHLWIPTLPEPELSFVRNFGHSAPLVRRDLVVKYGGYPRNRIKHYEDWLFNLTAMTAHIQVLVVPVRTQIYSVAIGLSRSGTNLAYEHESFGTMASHVLRRCAELGHERNLDFLSRYIGQAWLHERNIGRDVNAALLPRRYKVVDRIAQVIWRRPLLRKAVFKAGEYILKRYA